MKEGFTAKAATLNKLCPTCQEKCKQAAEVVVVSCTHYRRISGGGKSAT